MSSTELSKLNHRSNLAQWQQLVYDCRHSGMTVKAWCAECGISEKSYFYRQRKVWEAAQQEKAGEVTSAQPTLPAIIACSPPVMSEQQEYATAPCLVLRKEAWTVEVKAGCDPELLRLVLRTVK